MQRRPQENLKRKRWAVLIVIILAVVLVILLIGSIRNLGRGE